MHPLPRFLQFEWYQTFSSDVPTNDIANPVVYRININLFYGLVLMRDGRKGGEEEIFIPKGNYKLTYPFSLRPTRPIRCM